MATSLVKGFMPGAFAFGANAQAGEVVTIGDITYTFAADPTGEPFEVDIGDDAEDSLDNLAAAINLDGTDDDEYGAGTTQNPYVTAAVDAANDELDLTARIPGDQINGLHLASDVTSVTVEAAAFGLGANSGQVDGSGSVSEWAEDIETDGMQPNSQIIHELHKITEAAD